MKMHINKNIALAQQQSLFFSPSIPAHQVAPALAAADDVIFADPIVVGEDQIRSPESYGVAVTSRVDSKDNPTQNYAYRIGPWFINLILAVDNL